MVMVKIDGKETEFENQAAADEAMANADNIKAARNWAKAGIGGTKYRAEAFGLAIVTRCVDDSIKADKVKAKDLTAAQIFDYVESMSDDDIDDAVKVAKQLRADFAQLNGKHQAPMKGGLLPKHIAESASVLVKPETGAAQREGAKSRIVSVL